MAKLTYQGSIIKMDNVSLNYGGKPILRDLNMGIDDIVGHGQVVALVGPSGIGKTSLFRMMSGLHKPTKGQVLINCNGGESCHMKPVVSGEVGVVEQSYPLFNHYTIFKNLDIAAKVKEKNAEARRVMIMKLMVEFALFGQEDKFPYQLSGGQRQRVAIIQQILCSGHIILMDEPFSGLDVIAKDMAINLIKTFAEYHEVNTVVVVTHDVESAVMVADMVWIMGFEHDAEGTAIPGATIVDHMNLAEMGLAWTPNLENNPLYFDVVKDLKARLKTLGR